MTKQTLAFMFNNQINFFFLEKNVMVYREKRGGKKYFGINDTTRYTSKEIAEDVWKPICEFRTLDELWEYEYKGKPVKDWISPLNELNIDNFTTK